eukprot:10775080-Ditylum_brightwellii.AAC.1
MPISYIKHLAASLPVSVGCDFINKGGLPFDCVSIHLCHPTKLGFNRNSPCEIIYGSAKYGGLHFHHLYLEQGYLAIKHLIGHLREETIVGAQIMLMLSYI